MKKTTLMILLALSGAACARAQSIAPSALNATGKTATLSGNEFDWSVGEMSLVSTFTNASVVVTQGVLQPDDNLPLNATHTSQTAGRLQVFPNPATSVVNINYASPSAGTLSYKLMDMNGKLVSSQVMQLMQGANAEQLNVTELACATYMLNVTINGTDNTPETITYKIQKLK